MLFFDIFVQINYPNKDKQGCFSVQNKNLISLKLAFPMIWNRKKDNKCYLSFHCQRRIVKKRHEILHPSMGGGLHHFKGIILGFTDNFRTSYWVVNQAPHTATDSFQLKIRPLSQFVAQILLSFNLIKSDYISIYK